MKENFTSHISNEQMKRLTLIVLLTLVSFGHGALIGYEVLPEDPEPDTTKNEEPSTVQNFFYDGLLPLPMHWIARFQQKTNTTNGFGFGF